MSAEPLPWHSFPSEGLSWTHKNVFLTTKMCSCPWWTPSRLQGPCRYSPMDTSQIRGAPWAHKEVFSNIFWPEWTPSRLDGTHGHAKSVSTRNTFLNRADAGQAIEVHGHTNILEYKRMLWLRCHDTLQNRLFWQEMSSQPFWKFRTKETVTWNAQPLVMLGPATNKTCGILRYSPLIVQDKWWPWAEQGWVPSDSTGAILQWT